MDTTTIPDTVAATKVGLKNRSREPFGTVAMVKKRFSGTRPARALSAALALPPAADAEDAGRDSDAREHESRGLWDSLNLHPHGC